MLLIALLALQPPPPPPPIDEQEIVVVARRLQHISVTVRGLRGRLQCSLSGTTGHRDLDERLCRAATDCVRYGNRTPAAARACLEGTKPQLLADLRRARADATR